MMPGTASVSSASTRMLLPSAKDTRHMCLRPPSLPDQVHLQVGTMLRASSTDQRWCGFAEALIRHEAACRAHVCARPTSVWSGEPMRTDAEQLMGPAGRLLVDGRPAAEQQNTPMK